MATANLPTPNTPVDQHTNQELYYKELLDLAVAGHPKQALDMALAETDRLQAAHRLVEETATTAI